MPPIREIAATEPAVQGFWDALTKSRLIPPHELEDRLAIAPSSVRSRAVALADHLVRTRALTRFQADKLLQGFWQGLSVRAYQLLYPVARGGMGIVYLARDMRVPNGDRVVALKVLPPHRAKSESRMLTRFRREAEIGLALPASPFLAKTLDAGEENGVHFLAMEFAVGQTVRDLVVANGPLSVGAACRIFADVATGLDAAHQAGFVHRDIKPANVIVSETGRGKLLDFGFSLRQGEPTPADPTILGGPGHTLGTMDYLAPEQARDAATVGPAADIYALGCSLYYAVTGTVPFPGGSARDKIRRHQTDLPEAVTMINPAISVDFDHLLAALMGKRPKDRPATAAAVAALLSEWADPVSTTSATTEPKPQDLIRLMEDRWQNQQANLEAEIDDSSPPSSRDGTDEPAKTVTATRQIPGVDVARALWQGIASRLQRFPRIVIRILVGFALLVLLSGLVFWLRR
ncbi:MAG: serine/threonine protein kinase [Bacteroidales bacterium]|nr:serine/threonine protein kinase [Bacteroidales bacterium]